MDNLKQKELKYLIQTLALKLVKSDIIVKSKRLDESNDNMFIELYEGVTSACDIIETLLYAIKEVPNEAEK